MSGCSVIRGGGSSVVLSVVVDRSVNVAGDGVGTEVGFF